MKPSVFASFLSFLVTGILTLYNKDFKTDNFLVRFLIVTIFACGFYYYYLNVATENKWVVRQRPLSRKIASWWITALQYVGFLSLWTLLRYDLLWYAGGLLFLNTSYLIWDALHYSTVKKDKEGKVLFGLDIAGTICSALLVFSTPSLPPESITNNDSAHGAIVITSVCCLLSFQAIAGLVTTIFIFQYNPFRLLAMDGKPLREEKLTI